MELLLILGVIIVGLVLFLRVIENYGKNKYGEEEWRRQVSQANEEFQYGKGYGIKCPNCGRMNVEKISTLRKSASISVKGLASDKIGKTYECPDCHYIW